MTKVKGADLLIDAAHALKQRGLYLRLELAGDGPERAALEKQASRYGLDATFHGWVADKIKHQIFKRAEVLVMPSTWPEPFGLVGLEAAAYGIPTVAFDVGGVREWLHPGKNGVLAPANPPTAQGLATAIATVFANPRHWQQLAREARVAERPNQAAHVAALEEVLVRAGRDTVPGHH